MPGSGSASLINNLRTVRGTLPRTRLKQGSWARRVPALAGFEPALAGCVHQAGAVIAAGAGFPDPGILN